MAMLILQEELDKLRKKANLAQAVAESDKLVELLLNAREDIANSPDPHTTSLILTKLANPTSTAFQRITDALRPVDRGQKSYGKLLDRHFPSRQLPTEPDAMAEHTPLVNRAIAMHLLREGEFDVAQTFIKETKTREELGGFGRGHGPQRSRISIAAQSGSSRVPATRTGNIPPGDPDEDMGEGRIENEDAMAPIRSADLQRKFARMYDILSSLRERDLLPAITWAGEHSYELDGRGSNLEFELNRLQFIWLFQTAGTGNEAEAAAMTGQERMLRGRTAALEWAREKFPGAGMGGRHLREIQKLATALAFASNLPASPYRHVFDPAGIRSAFDEVGISFTRDFCSLLGLSAESPLYIAATAGAIALPQLLKYINYVKEKGTEWTTEAELAFETPLPRGMIYHPIFVCPVSKEQTTETNPPVMLPCGHVVAQESLQCLVKGTKAKCPYCPVEGRESDAKVIEIL